MPNTSSRMGLSAYPKPENAYCITAERVLKNTEEVSPLRRRHALTDEEGGDVIHRGDSS